MGLFNQANILSKCHMYPIKSSYVPVLSIDGPFYKAFRKPEAFQRRNLNTSSHSQDEHLLPEVINGIIAADKPKGISSTDVVRFFQRLLTRYYKNLPTNDTILPRLMGDRNYSKLTSSFKLPARRVGHGVIGVGTGTQSLHSFLNGDKVYSVTGRLGYTTDTLDLEGAPSSLTETQHITKELMERILPQFIGTITQEPPRYSAVRVDGKRLYEYARGSSTVKAGTKVEIPIRVVTATKIELVNFWHEEAQIEDRLVTLPHFELEVHCGKGFYIRSLVRDIGFALNSSAHVRELRRKIQSPFTLDSNAFAISDYLAIDFLKKVIQENNLLLQKSTK
ncbi:TruB pseudouridine (psi) synthase 1 [Entomophthora muscae]|uniref:TruB pseudouridine (Psi) synthase 1 n=1 Tax=Entomophthora muscae TaxID=34485 RepID=A0ACC2T7L0_9FUNG|nr:TruB pseudouridine (psi) synthase 1 [Entomophthora muscae]